MASKKLTIHERRKRIIPMLGKRQNTIEHIAKELNVSEPTIYADLREIKKNHDLIDPADIMRSSREAMARHNTDCEQTFEDYQLARDEWIGAKADMKGHLELIEEAFKVNTDTKSYNTARGNVAKEFKYFEKRLFNFQYAWRLAEWERAKFLKAVGIYVPEIQLQNINVDDHSTTIVFKGMPDPKGKTEKEIGKRGKGKD